MNDPSKRMNHGSYKEKMLLKKLLSNINGVLSMVLISVNTIFWFVPLIAVSFLKLMVPARPWRNFTTRILDAIARTWIAVNNFNIGWSKNISWNVTGLEDLKKRGWYLVISNHQSWTDIVVLQKVFNGKIPLLKFFLKKELIWVPFLGVAWWALDFPFIKRFTREYLDKNPHMAGKDLEITRRACEKFRNIPVSVMNFVEGTRFTPEKHGRQQSPYRNLLKPRAGGIGFVLSAMGDQLNTILDVTIVYPGGNAGIWEFMKGNVKEIVVAVNKIPITGDIIGDYENDTAFKEQFQEWLNGLWSRKDRLIDKMKSDAEHIK